MAGKSKPKMSAFEKRDRSADKKAGIREGSKRDMKMDKGKK